jgi:invasion protein IalB
MQHTPFVSRLVLAAVCSAAVAVPALAQPKSLGAFGDWSAFVDETAGKKVCYIGSKPKKAEGKYKERGEIYFLVSHRPAEKITGEVSIESGYAFKDGSDAVLTVDGKTFKLFTKGENAWARDAQGDRTIVEAMKTGKQMVVKGSSTRGTVTTDSYSLAGFAKAFEAISKACGVK